MKSPFLVAVAAGAAILLVAFLVPLLHMAFGGHAPTPEGQPWQLERHAGATRVFGLDLPGSTLADAKARWGDGLQVALMASRGGTGSLEGYVETFDAGGIAGRLVLAAELPEGERAQLQARAAKGEAVDADAVRYVLRADDRDAALRAPIAGITFIASANLDAAVLRERFGEPAERLATPPRLEHWLYPGRGLAIVLDAQGREVLQYVAPAEFDARLRQPLIRARAVPATGRPG